MSGTTTVSDLRREVLGRVTAAVGPLGFEATGSTQWCRRAPRTWQSVALSFLDSRHAATFRTTTASFGIEVGVSFDDPDIIGEEPGAPEPWRCDLRIALRRDFRQRPPSDELPEPDRRRRDLWWISRSGEEAEAAATSAARVVIRSGVGLLQKYADPRRALRTVRWSPGRGWFAWEPFNLGRLGSPYRRDLTARLARLLAAP